MTFLLIIPAAVFGAIALLVGSFSIIIEIVERRRPVGTSRRRIFRPVVIEGGKGKIATADPPQAAFGEVHAEPGPIKLVRLTPP